MKLQNEHLDKLLKHARAWKEEFAKYPHSSYFIESNSILVKVDEVISMIEEIKSHRGSK